MRDSLNSPAWRDELAGAVRGVVRLDEPLAARTTLGMGGPADLWLEPADVSDLASALEIARRWKIPWRVLGGGSNVLAADGGFRGMIVHLPEDFARMDVGIRGELVRVSYCAGMNNGVAHRHALESELVGLEFLAGIPGTLGGAVRMNAGARLGEMADVVESIEIVDADGGRSIEAVELGFSYRRSSVPRDGVVTRVAVLLRQADAMTLESARELAKKELRRRKSSQPKGRSAGSIFKNPEGDHAGRLIEAAGLKGRGVGGVYVSEEHANFLMNDGSGTAAEMLELIGICRAEVEARFGVRLKLEIELLGDGHAD